MQLSLQTHFTNLSREILKLSPGILSITGGGGKSSLMYSLGAALSQHGNNGLGARVLLTTTTRIMRPSPEQSRFFVESSFPDKLALPDIPCVMTAAAPAAPGQNPEYLRGYCAEEVDALWKRGAADWIIVEADGAARRPLKAPIAKEPVIPSLSRLVIAVAGLSAVGKAFDDKRVFRTEAFSAVTGLRPGDRLAPKALAALFTRPDGLFKSCPETAARMVFLNQADAAGALESAVDLARAILASHDDDIAGVYAGSARQTDAPCLRFAVIHPLYEFFESEIRPQLQEFRTHDHFLSEGLGPHTGNLRRVELEGKGLYACLDFYEKGQLDLNIMEKLGQDPLMQRLVPAGEEEKQKEALRRLEDALLNCPPPLPA